jgi:hypothetical protein
MERILGPCRHGSGVGKQRASYDGPARWHKQGTAACCACRCVHKLPPNYLAAVPVFNHCGVCMMTHTRRCCQCLCAVPSAVTPPSASTPSCVHVSVDILRMPTHLAHANDAQLPSHTWALPIPSVSGKLSSTQHALPPAPIPCLQVPITPDLVYSFGPQAHHPYSSLAGTFYAPVVNWVLSTPGEPYYAWDALTAACMMDPPLCKASHTGGAIERVSFGVFFDPVVACI